MANFTVRFFICNIFIAVLITILLAVKHLFRRSLSSRMQYHIWFLLLALLAVPFLPVHSLGFQNLLSWIKPLKALSSFHSEVSVQNASNRNQLSTANWMNDFSISVSRKTPAPLGILLLTIWLIGIAAAIVVLIQSQVHLYRLKQSSLPLQSPAVYRLYRQCLKEMRIKQEIPVYSTAFLTSPVITGLFRPCIYLPIHLISDYVASDMRYMLLHELQHYKHKDALANFMMNVAGIFYWFNPFVWYALKQMQSDREVACDTSVLQMLREEEYEAYGNTLINLAEKISLIPFPFVSGMSGSMKQMQQRIQNIISYEPPSFLRKIRGFTAFSMTGILLLCCTPVLSTYAAEQTYYQWNKNREQVSYIDLSEYFDNYEGCFVLYDLETDSWKLYNEEHAALRLSPNSTYKIYDALFGLEEKVITPEESLIEWNHKKYSFEAWNTDHNLYSAMQNSVNWYFQSIDAQLGNSAVKHYIQKIGYGNQTISNDLESYWMEASLKISAIEQVQLLQRLYENDFGFSPENVQAVKNSIYLSLSEDASLYGKTGTGCVNGQDVNGWFIGFTERYGQTCFFAVNIQAPASATGAAASKIALDILSDLQIWNS